MIISKSSSFIVRFSSRLLMRPYPLLFLLYRIRTLWLCLFAWGSTWCPITAHYSEAPWSLSPSPNQRSSPYRTSSWCFRWGLPLCSPCYSAISGIWRAALPTFGDSLLSIRVYSSFKFIRLQLAWSIPQELTQSFTNLRRDFTFFGSICKN